MMSNRRTMCLLLLPVLAVSAWLVGDHVLGQGAATNAAAPPEPAGPVALPPDPVPETTSEPIDIEPGPPSSGFPAPGLTQTPATGATQRSTGTSQVPSGGVLGSQPNPRYQPVPNYSRPSRGYDPYRPRTPQPAYAVNPYNPGPATATFTATRAIDPEMAKLLQEDQLMEIAAQELAASYRNEKDVKKRADLRTEIEALTEKHFALRQSRRDMEISKLTAQLERVRAAVTKRTDMKQTIIDRRISQLLGEQDELAF